MVFAGTGRMHPRSFLTVTALANLGVSATYAAVGASAARLESFLLLFAGVILIPGWRWLVRFLHRRPAKTKCGRADGLIASASRARTAWAARQRHPLRRRQPCTPTTIATA